MSMNWMDKFLDGFGGAIASGLRHTFGLFPEEGTRAGAPQAAGSLHRSGGVSMSWRALRGEEIDSFMTRNPESMTGSRFLAALLSHGMERLIPEAALELARMQLDNPACIIIAVLE